MKSQNIVLCIFEKFWLLCQKRHQKEIALPLYISQVAQSVTHHYQNATTSDRCGDGGGWWFRTTKNVQSVILGWYQKTDSKQNTFARCAGQRDVKGCGLFLHLRHQKVVARSLNYFLLFYSFSQKILYFNNILILDITYMTQPCVLTFWYKNNLTHCVSPLSPLK